jgi:Fe-S oxidoreductase
VPAKIEHHMQTHLSPEFSGTREGQAAEAILRKCVHCGFCTATCPTYQLLGDELDGPRGRIYLMKQVLEGGEVTRSTQQHLDRCLTCRNCESTCPSGVDYGHLVEIGRNIVEARVERPLGEKVMRTALKEGLTSPLFGPAMKLGQLVRPLLPAALKNKVPAPAPASAHVWPHNEHPRKMLMLAGCVQPAMMPNINSATARVLDAAGIQTLVRRHPLAPERCRGRPERHAPQHRRLVAVCGRWARGSHRDECLGLRRHRQGLRARPGARPSLCRQGPTHQRAHPGSVRAATRFGS